MKRLFLAACLLIATQCKSQISKPLTLTTFKSLVYDNGFSDIQERLDSAGYLFKPTGDENDSTAALYFESKDRRTYCDGILMYPIRRRVGINYKTVLLKNDKRIYSDWLSIIKNDTAYTKIKDLADNRHSQISYSDNFYTISFEQMIIEGYTAYSVSVEIEPLAATFYKRERGR